MPRPKLRQPRGEKRHVMTVPLYDELEAKLEKAIGKSGLSKVEFIARLLGFFADQEDYVQAYMLNHIPESQKVDFAKMLLMKMADADGGGSPGLRIAATDEPPDTDPPAGKYRRPR